MPAQSVSTRTGVNWRTRNQVGRRRHTAARTSHPRTITTPPIEHRRALPREGWVPPVRCSARHLPGPQRTSLACTLPQRVHCVRTTRPAKGAGQGTLRRLSPALGGKEGSPGLWEARSTMTRPSPRSGRPLAGRARTAPLLRATTQASPLTATARTRPTTDISPTTLRMCLAREPPRFSTAVRTPGVPAQDQDGLAAGLSRAQG